MFPCSRGCGVSYSYERNLARHMAYECPLLPPIPSQLQVTGSRRADVPPSRRQLLLSLPPPLPLPLPSPHRLLPSLHLDSLLPPVTTPLLATGQRTSLVPPTLAALSPNLLPPTYLPPYSTPPTTLCQYLTPPTSRYQYPPSSPTPNHFQYPTPPPTPHQFLTPPPTPFLYPTPPSTPCSAPTTPILVLHQGSSPSLDPGGWRHPDLGSSQLPTAPPGVSILLIKGNPVKLPLLYLLLLLLPLMFLLILLLSFLFLHILLLPVLLLLNTGTSSLHAHPAPVPTISFLRHHGPPSLPQNS